MDLGKFSRINAKNTLSVLFAELKQEFVKGFFSQKIVLEWFVCKNWQFVQNRWENIPHLQFFVKNAAMYTFCLGEIKSFI